MPQSRQSETAMNPHLLGQLQSFSSESCEIPKLDLPETSQSLIRTDLQPIKSESVVSKTKSIYSELSDPANPVVHLLEPLLV